MVTSTKDITITRSDKVVTAQFTPDEYKKIRHFLYTIYLKNDICLSPNDADGFDLLQEMFDV